MADWTDEFAKSLFVGVNREGEMDAGRMPQQTTKSWLKDWKNMGNDAFVSKDYKTAEERYTVAVTLYRSKWAESEQNGEIDDDDKLVICQIFANRSACRYELRKYTASLADAEEAISINPFYWKSYYRAANACDELGSKSKSIHMLLQGVKLGRPEREQRCIMLVGALLSAFKLPPDPVAALTMMLLGGCHLTPYMRDIIVLVQNAIQWQRIFRLLAKQNEWKAAETLLNVVEGELILECGKQTHLKGLVLFAEQNEVGWCDTLGRNLLLHGAHHQTLEIDGDPAIFGALRLALRGEGSFATLQYFLEFVLISNAQEKNAVNTHGQNMYEFIDQYEASSDIKTDLRKMLRKYRIGVHVKGNVMSVAHIEMVNNEAARLINDKCEFDKAALILTQALENTGLDTPNELQALLYFNRCGAYINCGRLHEARRDATTGVAIQPDILGYTRLRMIYEKLGLDVMEARMSMYMMKLQSEEAVELTMNGVLLLCPADDRSCIEEMISIMNPSLVIWDRVISLLFVNERWEMLSMIFSFPLEKQGYLRDYSAERLQLWKLISIPSETQSAIVISLFIHLIERGAKVNSIMPDSDDIIFKMLIKDRPVSLAFVQAIFGTGVNGFLDYLLERKDELKEPKYPDGANLIHRLIEHYKTLTTSEKIKFTVSIGFLVAKSSRKDIILGLTDPETEMYNRCEKVLSNNVSKANRG